MSKFKIVPSEEDVTAEEAMQEFNEQYAKIANLSKDFNALPEEVKNSIAGRILGGVNTKLKKLAKELDAELIEGDTAGSIELLTEKLNETKETLTKEIEDARKGNPDIEEKLKSFEKKLESEKELVKRLKEDLNNEKAEREKVVSEFSAREKTVMLNEYKRNQLSKIPLLDDEVAHLAFQKKLEDFKLEIEENEVKVFGKDGKPIISKKQAGSFANLEEIGMEIADSLKLLKKAPESAYVAPLAPPNGGERKQPRG